MVELNPGSRQLPGVACETSFQTISARRRKQGSLNTLGVTSPRMGKLGLGFWTLSYGFALA